LPFYKKFKNNDRVAILLNDMSKTSLRSVLIGVFRNKNAVLQHECIFVVTSGHILVQPRTQALSSTLLAGENTLAGAGHVTHTKLIAYQGDGKVSGLILHASTSALHTSIARSGRLNNHLSESYILQNTY
jgi:hypothetical protein